MFKTISENQLKRIYVRYYNYNLPRVIQDHKKIDCEGEISIDDTMKARKTPLQNFREYMNLANFLPKNMSANQCHVVSSSIIKRRFTIISYNGNILKDRVIITKHLIWGSIG